LATRLYADLSEQCPQFSPTYIHSYILVSSPNAVVYLHLDSYENLLWLVRGGKEMHLFLPADRRMVDDSLMEDICSGADDFFAYDPSYEDFGRTYHLTAGEFMSWPQHSPHWVRNNDQLNVGLGTFHGTVDGERRTLDYVANGYFRQRWPLLAGTVRHGSVSALARRTAFRMMRRFKGVPARPATEFWAKHQLDPDSRIGTRLLTDGPRLAEYSPQQAA